MNNSYLGTDLDETQKDGAEVDGDGMELSGPGPTSTVLCVLELAASSSSGSFFLPGNDEM